MRASHRQFRFVPSLVAPIAGLVLLAASAPAPAQVTTRSSVDSAGAQANHNSFWPSIAADGTRVAFYSFASNLVAGDKNGAYDVFVRDAVSGTTERVSVDSAGAEVNSSSWYPSLSADGEVVAFESDASNLVAGDANGARDVFVHDGLSGLTERMSVDSAGVEGDAGSSAAAISADGRYVVFQSSATNLVAGDTNGWPDVFVHDRVTGTTERVSVDSAGVQGSSDSHGPALSADGQFVAFWSYASNLVAGDTNFSADVFVHDRSTGITERVSVDSSGVEGFGNSSSPSLSGDGRFVAFDSAAKNLVPNDNNASGDVFVHDRTAGTTERASVDTSGVEGNKTSSLPAISADGQSVAFQSYASNLVAGDANNRPDVFVHDRATGFTDRMSVDTSGGDDNGDCLYKSISADGRVVAFSSLASDLVAGDTNGAWDVFARDRCAVDASWTNYGAGFAGTNGVPSFTARADPVLGSTLTLDFGNSFGAATAGLLFVGFQRASIHSSWGGDLLVVPALTIPIGVPPAGLSFTGALPHDFRLGGLAIDLQGVEFDAGAAHGVSFTPGLELVLGC